MAKVIGEREARVNGAKAMVAGEKEAKEKGMENPGKANAGAFMDLILWGLGHGEAKAAGPMSPNGETETGEANQDMRHH